jgi:murein DD-endopeptidase MepM/ murein hydrolase activator NlpD
MRSGRRCYTIVVQRDGSLESQTHRIPVRTVRLAAAAAAAFGVLLLVLGALYAPILRAAARVPGLQRDLARVKMENAKIVQLSAAVDSLEQRYAQVRKMIGADIVPDPLRSSSSLPVAPAIHAHTRVMSRLASGPTVPRYWPLDEAGFLTRGQVGGDSSRDEPHPGIDIAVAVGSPVRAAGGGSVMQSGEDPEYGWFVLLQHPDSYQTMYGHLSRLLVRQGETVEPGQVIGLTGNSGRSSAPHLHFEIRQNGAPLDPLTMVKEQRQ